MSKALFLNAPVNATNRNISVKTFYVFHLVMYLRCSTFFKFSTFFKIKTLHIIV